MNISYIFLVLIRIAEKIKVGLIPDRNWRNWQLLVLRGRFRNSRAETWQRRAPPNIKNMKAVPDGE